MGSPNVKDVLDSKSAVEAVKSLKPSSVFLALMVFIPPFLIRFLFNDVSGYEIMVWIWFACSIMSFVIGSIAYYKDVNSEYKKRMLTSVEV
ncbi:hypothetical protein ACO1PF_00410 [Alkalibacterium sp. f15]|uniref:hypothetical protein n=1 Tax=Alkalibacterium sp. f15 TaxID=3414029 RepID=UPI003BF78E40